MSHGRLVTLLAFAGRVEKDAGDGVIYVRIDDETAPGRVRKAHAALEEKLATQEAFESDLAPGRETRITGLMSDLSAKVLRVKTEVA
jgi:hypothetical protein